MTLPILDVRGRLGIGFTGLGWSLPERVAAFLNVGGQGLHVEIRHVFNVSYLENLEYSKNSVS